MMWGMLFLSSTVVPQLSHCSNSVAYNIGARTAQRTPFLPCKRACLRSRYSITAVVFLLISQSLPSNGSTCHNMQCDTVLSSSRALG
jgi:hypothetical protein